MDEISSKGIAICFLYSKLTDFRNVKKTSVVFGQNPLVKNCTIKKRRS